MLFSAFLFLYGYSILDDKNHNTALKVAESEQSYQDLLYEQVGFEQGRRDLKEIEEAEFSPNKLFPKNTTLVDNIRVLEDVANRYNLEFVILLSGTGVGDLRTPGVVSEIFSAPYSLTLTGQFRDVMSFFQTIENLQFPTHITNVQINAIVDGEVTAILNSEFFIEQ